MCNFPLFLLREDHSGYVFSIIEVFVVIIFLASIVLIIKKFKHVLLRVLFICLSTVSFILLSMGLFFCTLFFLEAIDDPQGSYYFPLNAAIKNTCYLDPERKHCPNTLSELISIEDKNFSKYLKDSYLFYDYRSESNDYTLVALKKGIGQEGIIFDSRLDDVKGQPDFIHIDYNHCNGKIQIKDQLPITGIWENLSI